MVNAADFRSARLGAAGKYKSGVQGVQSSFSEAAVLLACLDCMAVLGAAIAGKWIYINFYSNSNESTLPYAGVGGMLALILYWCFAARGMYRPDVIRSSVIRPSEYGSGLALAFLIFLGLLYLAECEELAPRGWVIISAFLSLLGVLMVRFAWRRISTHLVAWGHLGETVVLITSKDLATNVSERLTSSAPHIRIAAVFTGDSSGSRSFIANADISNLATRCRGRMVDKIILAVPGEYKHRLWEAIDRVAVLGKDVQIYTEDEVLPVSVRPGTRSGEVALRTVVTSPPVYRGRLAKSILDYSLASLALLILAPVLALIALCIRFDSRGPVIFKQRRYGEKGAIFTVYKFRTMSVLEDGAAIKQAMKDDARVTRVGRFLRRWSLDELPQIFNVLKGDMSIVGPRPHAVAHVEFYAARVERFAWRHRVKPGITGWAQVNGLRGPTETQEKMRRRLDYDLYYIDNWSLWFDIEIILRTCVSVFSGKGAF